MSEEVSSPRPGGGPTAVSVPPANLADPVPGRRRWLVLAVIGLAQLMVVLDATIVNIALPSAQRALGFATVDRQWVITAYALAFGGLLIVGGRLSDLLGRKRTFIIGLVAARAVQGAFGALLTTTCTDPRERGKALGIYTAIAGGGGAIGLILGGVLTEYLSWRWCPYVNVAFAAVALAGAVPLIGNQPRNPGARLDVPGSLLAVGGLTGIVYGCSQAAADGWASASTLGPIIAGVVLLAAFVAVERRVTRPLVPQGIIANRNRGTAYLGALIAGIGLIGTFLLVTYYLQNVLGFSPLRTGLAFLPFIAGVIAAANFVSNRGLGERACSPASGPTAATVRGWRLRWSSWGSAPAAS